MEIKKEGLHVYAVYDYEDNPYYFDTEYPVIKYNCPKSLLPLQVREQDGEKTIYFEITGRCSFLKWGEKKVMKYEDCYKLLQSFLNLYRDLEDYLLSMDQISFRKEDMYVNANQQLQWMYISGKRCDIQKELEDLFQWLLSLLDFKDKRALDITYRLFHCIKKEGLSRELLENILNQDADASYDTEHGSDDAHRNFHDYHHGEERHMNLSGPQESNDGTKKESKNRKIGNILKCVLLVIFTLVNVAMAAVLAYWIYMRGATLQLTVGFICNLIVFILIQIFLNPYFSDQHPAPSNEVDEWEDSHEKILPIPSHKKKVESVNCNTMKKYDDTKKYGDIKKYDDIKQEKSSIFEELEKYWDKSDETVLLTSSMDTVSPVLYSDKTKESIEIKVFPFYIGSEEGLNQLSLKNRAVSRQHAVITKSEDDIFYIEDLNSKNGTRVNGNIVYPEKPISLHNESRILFADDMWNFVIH